MSITDESVQVMQAPTEQMFEPWEPKLATTPERIKDLELARNYIEAMDFTALKTKMMNKDEGGLGWSPGKVAYVERQYKNWLYLRRKFEGEILPPSIDIDHFWHWHMLDTRTYHRDMARIFGGYLHHFPYFGVRGEEDYQYLLDAYENTQQRYLAEFGEEIYEYEEDDAVTGSIETASPVIEEEKGDVFAKELPYFLHINKNAGHTVRYILYNNYRGENFFNVMVRGRKSINEQAKTVNSSDEDVIHTIAETRARQKELACIAANLPFGIDWFLNRPVTYFTFMREPVSRCISYWYFAYAARHEHPLWSTLESYDFDLQRILDARVAYQFTNDQVRMISGSSAPNPGEDELRLARELIEERYLLVGAVEKFDLCLRLIARHFGWDNLSYEKQNVGDKSEPSILPEHAETLFREANEWDIRLYEWLISDYLPRRLEA